MTMNTRTARRVRAAVNLHQFHEFYVDRLARSDMPIQDAAEFGLLLREHARAVLGRDFPLYYTIVIRRARRLANRAAAKAVLNGAKGMAR